MTKTLKDLFEVYKPKSPDEQKFVDKHVTIKHKDRNGNGDDVFKADNVKPIKRKEERHGYDAGEDEKVYEEIDKDLEDELMSQRAGPDGAAWRAKKKAAAKKTTNEEVEDLDESVAKVANHLIKRYGENVRKSHVRSAANDFGVGFVALSHHVRKKLGVNRLEEEQIDELSKKTLAKYIPAAAKDAERAGAHQEYYGSDQDFRDGRNRQRGIERAVKKLAKEEAEQIEEKKLTPAELKKREEIAKAMERENPGMDKSKKMAIATATAKRVAEELEAIEMDETLDEATKAQMRADLADLIAKSGIKPTKLPTRKAKGLTKNLMASRHIGKFNPYKGKAGTGAGANTIGKAVVGEETDYLETNLKKRKKNNDKAIEDMKKMGSPMKNPHFGEEVESIDEISATTLRSYTDKASDARGHRNLPTAKLDKRYKGVALAHEKIRGRHTQVPANEEVQIDELSKTTLSSYAKKATGSAAGYAAATAAQASSSVGKADDKTKRQLRNRLTGASKAIDKLAKEEVINRAIEKFMPELEDYKPMTQEEKLVAKLDGLSESHIHLLLDLFENLNEDNRTKMLQSLDTREGVNSLIDFALNNRGE